MCSHKLARQCLKVGNKSCVFCKLYIWKVLLQNKQENTSLKHTNNTYTTREWTKAFVLFYTQGKCNSNPNIKNSHNSTITEWKHHQKLLHLYFSIIIWEVNCRTPSNLKPGRGKFKMQSSKSLLLLSISLNYRKLRTLLLNCINQSKLTVIYCQLYSIAVRTPSIYFEMACTDVWTHPVKWFTELNIQKTETHPKKVIKTGFPYYRQSWLNVMGRNNHRRARRNNGSAAALVYSTTVLALIPLWHKSLDH